VVVDEPLHEIMPGCGVVKASEVDGGALTPAECEAKMRDDRDRAMRIGLGFEVAEPSKPRPTEPTESERDRRLTKAYRDRYRPEPETNAPRLVFDVDRKLTQEDVDILVRGYKDWEYRRAYGGHMESKMQQYRAPTEKQLNEYFHRLYG
jgi:hypothetical protein